ncbi:MULTISPECIES: hypothetical protein [unclassified Pseudoalteromonas]|uniref:hypothetical protein n=1 Tax=unclassified Pseudoalteromonas TaxID=194690 RepID=UPI001F30109D|nr:MULTISPECIES: hypothetical protein [unclassified Pseudoalteromonas]MCF2829605.1 hypothetical protein [Pseudoalteromonas sp. OF5H-5]MCF2830861.1 hypothetical protein [Pseudoalteromonas sp. DL2-H6]MCF2927311.1 hypothetical protein [Pseudoalteromonas sp. DL2-H1]
MKTFLKNTLIISVAVLALQALLLGLVISNPSAIVNGADSFLAGLVAMNKSTVTIGSITDILVIVASLVLTFRFEKGLAWLVRSKRLSQAHADYLQTKKVRVLVALLAVPILTVIA